MSTFVEAATQLTNILAAADGPQIAANLKAFAAPVAGILIGLVGLKYLFGEHRSFAGFLGFVLLGICVFALIQFGEPILNTLGEAVKNILGAQ